MKRAGKRAGYATRQKHAGDDVVAVMCGQSYRHDFGQRSGRCQAAQIQSIDYRVPVAAMPVVFIYVLWLVTTLLTIQQHIVLLY